jgi:hypothetical protein
VTTTHWTNLAVAAVYAQSNGRHHEVSAHVDVLLDEHHGHVRDAVTMWADGACSARHWPRGAVVDLGFRDSGGRPCDPAGLDPAVVWAWRVLAAWIARDEAMVDALIATVPGEHRRVHLFAMVALTASLVRDGGGATMRLTVIG